MKKLLGVVVLLLLALAGVMVARTLLVRPPSSAEVPAGVPPQLDHHQAAEHLAGAVRFPTVSLSSGGPIDTTAFLGLHQYLADTHPLVTQHLQREVVGGLSLLYTWRGTDPTLPPLVLMGHQDVVPVPERSPADWTHPPFAGEIADGFVWGRGALDDKVTRGRDPRGDRVAAPARASSPSPDLLPLPSATTRRSAALRRPADRRRCWRPRGQPYLVAGRGRRDDRGSSCRASRVRRRSWASPRRAT